MNGFIEFLDSIAGERKDVLGQEEWHYCCPFCNEDNFKFYVNVNTQWICYKCGKKGNAYTFFREYYNGITSLEIRRLMEDWGIGQQENIISRVGAGLSPMEALFLAMSSRDKNKEETVAVKKAAPLPKGFKLLSQHFNDQEAYPFFYYLYHRGVSIEQIRDYYIGYVTFGSTVTAKGKTISLRNHIVFPIMDGGGNLRYWTTRSIESHPYLKSINAPSSAGYYNRQECIFNLDQAARTGKIVVCEGIFNALTVGVSGIATLGKMVTHTQVDMIREKCKLNPNLRLYIFLDPDAKKEAVSLCNRLSHFTSNVYFVLNNTDKDANDLGKDRCKKLIETAIPSQGLGSLVFITM